MTGRADDLPVPPGTYYNWRQGRIVHYPKQIQNAPWECPRCGTINAWWVPRCRCQPTKRDTCA